MGRTTRNCWLAMAGVLGVGCTDLKGGDEPTQIAAAAQTAPKTAVPDGPDTGATRLSGALVDARVLVITTDGSDPASAAVQAALTRLGTPFDVHDATHGMRLTADQLASGNHGRYNAVILDRGTLLTSGGTSAFTDDEWQALANYEATFGVRRAALYTLPDAGYGFGTDVAMASGTVNGHCTPAGQTIFAGANCANPVVIAGTVVYSASAADSKTVPLLVDDAGHALAVTRSYADGREALALTFDQIDGDAFTTQLLYGVIRWASRGLFLGERHVYLSAQIDDLFLASAMYDGSPAYRCSDADIQSFFDWQQGRRQSPVTAGFRASFCVNTAKAVDGDALTAKVQAIGSGFAYINHTWDHLDMTTMDYADAYNEFTKNDQRVMQLGLMPYDPIAAVTPDVSGLANPNMLSAAVAAGIKYLVSDTSQPGQNNPSYNEGIPSTLQPGIFVIPRRPTDLYFNVSTPDQWVYEYNIREGSSRDYAGIVDHVSGTLLGYLLRGENDPVMFHQANTRDNGGGHSILSDLLDATLDKYTALMTVPVYSPTMDQLGQRVAARNSYDTAGASATVASDGRVTVHVANNAATVPITGLCTATAESYAGDQITYVDVTPGNDVTVMPVGCPGATAGATSPDGGAHDTGPHDAGPSDTGPQDAGAGGGLPASGSDAATVDASDPLTSVSLVKTTPGGQGCSCTAVPAPDLKPLLGLCLAMGLMLAASRRR
ncbi:MAG TPA: polysaccharide deacetylase family protein [Polyangia bacterium]|nr:polysaccharide deacetylase family protein [Polyangia bacterium]